jgi:hypothetical protein
MPTSVRTICGVVPALRTGDCVTVLASVLLADIRMGTEEGCRGTPSTVDISIQGLWSEGDDDPSMAPKDFRDLAGEETEERRGAVLCVLRLPAEMLLLTPPMTPPPRSGRWIRHEVDFVLGGHGNDDDRCPGPKPSAIFEYLQPRTIAIDGSGGLSCTHDVETWKRFVSAMNASVGGNSFVDLYCERGDPRIRLVIFGSNPDERAGEFARVFVVRVRWCRCSRPARAHHALWDGSVTVKHVLSNLPESAKLIVEDSNEKENVRALLVSLKKEADALRRHRASSSSGGITPDAIAEIAALQGDTDGIASTFERGWV